ncbi:MAG: hypothetical protein ACHQ6U_11510 [Thermodesulfobacteriota bacterium]
MTKRAERVKREIKNIFGTDAQKPANIAKEYSSLYIKACKAFGSWKCAIEACGLDYESSRNNRKWTRERIKREILRLGGNGNSLRPSVLRKDGLTTLVSAAEYHFGSWRRAVESCGLDYSFGRRKKCMRLTA